MLAELSLGRNIGHELKDLERSRVEGLTHKEYPKIEVQTHFKATAT